MECCCNPFITANSLTSPQKHSESMKHLEGMDVVSDALVTCSLEGREGLELVTGTNTSPVEML